MATTKNLHWPQDLVNEILLNLPVKSIIRFKCVAKTWNSLFENPSFVSQHLSISKRKNNLILVHNCDDEFRSSVIRMFPDQTLFQQIPQHFNTPKLVCVHDGLLCLSDATNSRISLWNPATRKFRLLPECNENIPPNVRTNGHHIGFGSDPFTNDYKVISIRCFTRNNPAQLAVYRMSTDSWKQLQVEDFDFFKRLYIPHNHSYTCVNGVYYWVAWEYPFSKVLAFHFGNEDFRLIDWPKVPDELTNTEKHTVGIGELIRLSDNRISLWLPRDIGTINISYDIWVLSEDRRYYWTKLLRVGPLSGVRRMFGFSNKKGNKVYVESVSQQVLIYDLDTQEFRDTGNIIGGGLYRLYFDTFEDSLIDVSRVLSRAIDTAT